jgi:hypothetical protein
MGKVVKAKKIPKPDAGDQLTEAIYTVVYHYPQYTIQEARQLPLNHVMKLIEKARKEKASEYMMLLNISSAPHTKNGAGVKKLQSNLQRMMDG